MKVDAYTTAVLTVIAIMLTVIAVLACRPLISWILDALNNPALQMLLGAVVSAVVSVFVIWLSRPKLKLFIDEPFFGQTADADRNPREKYRAARVVVANIKRFPKFWPRQTLIRTIASITFHDAETGANIFDGRQMRGRWASLPQPEVIVLVDGKKVLLPDPSLVASIPEIDIPWGKKSRSISLFGLRTSPSPTVGVTRTTTIRKNNTAQRSGVFLKAAWLKWWCEVREKRVRAFIGSGV